MRHTHLGKCLHFKKLASSTNDYLFKPIKSHIHISHFFTCNAMLKLDILTMLGSNCV